MTGIALSLSRVKMLSMIVDMMTNVLQRQEQLTRWIMVLSRPTKQKRHVRREPATATATAKK